MGVERGSRAVRREVPGGFTVIPVARSAQYQGATGVQTGVHYGAQTGWQTGVHEGWHCPGQTVWQEAAWARASCSIARIVKAGATYASFLSTVLRDAGVTRLSVGVQSFDDGLLAGMERLEKYGSGELIRQRLADVQGIFPTLNVDMIFNLPGQSLAMLEHDLDVLHGLSVDQISFYPLMTAPTARHKMEKSMGHSDPSLRHPMYKRILERVLGAEYHAASAWCFSRNQGMFDEYIIDQDDYVGVGSGAFSYVGGAYYSTTFSLNHYCRRIEGGQSGITQRRPVGLKDRMRYDYLVRLFGGELKRDYIERRYGKAFWLYMAPELLSMRAIGATRHDEDAIRLTHRGMYCWVLMMAEFFNSVNSVREQMREHIRAELEAWNEEAKVPLAAIGRAAAREAPGR